MQPHRPAGAHGTASRRRAKVVLAGGPRGHWPWATLGRQGGEGGLQRVSPGGDGDLEDSPSLQQGVAIGTKLGTLGSGSSGQNLGGAVAEGVWGQGGVCSH